MNENEKEKIKKEKLEKLKNISDEVLKVYGTEDDKKKLKLKKDECDEER